MSPNPVTARICEKLVFFTWISGLWFQSAQRTVIDKQEYNKSAHRRQSFQKNLVDSALGRQYESMIDIVVTEDGSISATVCEFSLQDLPSSVITNFDERILRKEISLRNHTPWENNRVEACTQGNS